MLRQAAEKTGDAVGDGTSDRDDPRARDLRRRRPQRGGRGQRHRPEARPRPRRCAAAVEALRELSRPVQTRARRRPRSRPSRRTTTPRSASWWPTPWRRSAARA
ncbi:MAG: hypothetical protein MZV65_37955 [Chromatiales bacterium]|nr:hypothetical protein [Chromatiales bacterium]